MTSYAECLHDTAHLVRYSYLLGTLRQTFLTILTCTGPGLCIRQCLTIASSILICASRALNAVLAGGTGDGREACHLVSDVGQQRVLCFRTNLQR